MENVEDKLSALDKSLIYLDSYTFENKISKKKPYKFLNEVYNLIVYIIKTYFDNLYNANKLVSVSKYKTDNTLMKIIINDRHMLMSSDFTFFWLKFVDFLKKRDLRYLEILYSDNKLGIGFVDCKDNDLLKYVIKECGETDELCTMMENTKL